jgi:hypothetical protein
MINRYFTLPHCGIGCQGDYTLLQILMQMDGFISYDSNNIVNDMMDGRELGVIKFRY